MCSMIWKNIYPQIHSYNSLVLCCQFYTLDIFGLKAPLTISEQPQIIILFSCVVFFKVSQPH